MNRGTALLAHSGGPTAVINASLQGVVQRARELACFDRFWGARYGMEGILAEDFLDLFAQSGTTLEAVAEAPSSALGTSRFEAGPEHLQKVVQVFQRNDIRCLFYTGGNGSMITAQQITAATADAHYDLQVIGIPKTIDNDLLCTDHTPGYGSAARFFAHAVRDIGQDNLALRGQVEIIEILGRNSGWLAAATSLARHAAHDAPHLIYLPENPLSLDVFLADVERVYRHRQRCVVAVCEGQLDHTGKPFGADVRRGSRGSLAMNLAHRLALLVTEHLGLRARSEKPGLLGRSSGAYPSPTDRQEARLCGEAAADAACRGESGMMVSLERLDGPDYSVRCGLVPLTQVAAGERLFPSEWVTPERNGILNGFRQYALPIVGSVEPHPTLSKQSRNIP